MKRLLWLSSLVCLCPLTMLACGDDSGSNGGADGGVSTADIDEVNNRIDVVQKGLSDDLADLEDSLTDITTDLDDRLKALEEIPLCSAEEDCIPDGITVARMGLESVVRAMCNNEINCCSADELNHKFGAGITDVASCTATFVDLVNNGFSPDFLTSNGSVIRSVIDIAQAINNSVLSIEIDTAGVAACVTHLEAQECPKYVADPEDERCLPYAASTEADPCSLANIVNGLQKLGEECGIVYSYYGGPFPECVDGTVCRRDASNAHCAEPPAEGEHCTSDYECDTDGDSDEGGGPPSDLFCNRLTGLCQPVGGPGDDCLYIEPTFTSRQSELDPYDYTGYNIDIDQSRATSEDCARGLHCDPTKHVCVPSCSDGAICRTNTGAGPNADCPDGLVCNITEIPTLSNPSSPWYNPWAGNRTLGVCRAATADGAPCASLNSGSECASDRCIGNPASNGFPDPSFVCGAARAAVGATCPAPATPGTNSECESGLCDDTGHCSALCSRSADCAAGNYCDSDAFVDESTYGCNPKIADASPCDQEVGGNSHNTCTSGFCNGANCAAKAAPGGACTSTQNEECPAGQYCLAAVCTAFVATDGACTTPGQPGGACGPNAYCYDGPVTDVCRPFAAEGAACNPTDAQCALGLSCAMVGSAGTCQYGREFPLGASCNLVASDEQGVPVYGDDVCASDWCPETTNVCTDKIADGSPCDVIGDSGGLDTCVDGSFCNYALRSNLDPDNGEGTCAAKRTAGQACEPRFGSVDCVPGGGCELRNDQHVCNTNAIPPETLFCDGE